MGLFACQRLWNNGTNSPGLVIMLALKVILFCDVEGLLQVIDTYGDSVTMVAIGVVYDGLHIGKDSINLAQDAFL